MSRLLASITVPAHLLDCVAPGELEQHIQAAIKERWLKHLQSEIDASIRGTSAIASPSSLLNEGIGLA